MARYKVNLNRPDCIGCGACVAACPSNWEMQSDGKTQNKKDVIEDSEYAENREAEEVCPVNVIKISKISDL